jgi:hypothetical protein
LTKTRKHKNNFVLLQPSEAFKHVTSFNQAPPLITNSNGGNYCTAEIYWTRSRERNEKLPGFGTACNITAFYYTYNTSIILVSTVKENTELAGSNGRILLPDIT